jgi:hypothetical protein
MSTITIQRSHGAAIAAVIALVGLLLWQAPWAARARELDAAQAPNELTVPQQTAETAVDCEPTQQALVRQAVVDGRVQVRVQCVTQSGVAPANAAYVYGPAAPVALPVSALASAPAMVPAVYRPAAPARVAAAPAPRRTAARDVRPARTWQKRAMVIGGAAGAGAGIGALIGGKKGALIGAAIGGGGGTVYEMTKNR